MTHLIDFPILPLPKPGQLRAYWRAPASASALAVAIAAAAAQHRAPLLLVARDNHAAHQLEADLHTLLGGDPALPVLTFPDWETLPYDLFSPHPDIVSQRLATLARLPGLRADRGGAGRHLMQRVAPLAHVIGNRLISARPQPTRRREVPPEAAGYRHAAGVRPRDFAVRGGLLDVFDGRRGAVPIELLDDEIDSIRAFDPESQRSLERIERIELLPGREVPLDEAPVRRALDALRDRFDIDTRRSALVQDLKAGLAPAGIEYYLPLFHAGTATLFDYLGSGMLPVLGEGVFEAAEHAWAQIGVRHDQLRHDVERPLLPPAELWLSPDALREAPTVASASRSGMAPICAPRRRPPAAVATRATVLPLAAMRRRRRATSRGTTPVACWSPPIRPAGARRCWKCCRRRDCSPRCSRTAGVRRSHRGARGEPTLEYGDSVRPASAAVAQVRHRGGPVRRRLRAR
jgi:transcription-repair coupling factor (superfamily II helicase)